MAPFTWPVRRDADPASAFAAEWVTPSNYAFTILLLLGGDVVSRALAQLAGRRFTPVAFSFGWVSYATTAINSAVGENKLMPPTDVACTVINAKSGQSRSNNSWVLGRLMRDFEFWQGDPVRRKVEEVRAAKKAFDDERKRDAVGGESSPPDSPPDPLTTPAGLVVSFWTFDSDHAKSLMEPGKDVLYWSGIVVYLVQLGVAAIPCGLDGDWSVLVVTTAAIVLCLITGASEQWRREKWRCREIPPGKEAAYFLTRGNGAQHALLIQCNGFGLNLEDLCTGYDNIDTPSISLLTRLTMIVLGVLWVCLLITSSAIVDSAWYLIAVGGVGMLQNIFVAGWSRKPEAFGIPLKFDQVVGFPKVFATLEEVERQYPKAGKALVSTFFPADINDGEKERLKKAGEEGKKRKMQKADAKS